MRVFLLVCAAFMLSGTDTTAPKKKKTQLLTHAVFPECTAATMPERVTAEAQFRIVGELIEDERRD